MQSQSLIQSASPARRGLSSPPPTNPTPNPSNPANPSPLPPPAPTSTSLLPLLPPVPRSQALLSLLASLASSLFETSPHRPLYVSAYRGSLPNFLPSSSSVAAPTPASKEELMSLIGSFQSQLFDSVSQLQEILDLQDARVRATREARATDAALLAFTCKLREAHSVLDRLVDDYADYRVDPKRPRVDGANNEGFGLKSSLALEDVLSYAHKISYTTFAPPEHGAGAPLKGALPPAPQDNEMRASQLYQFADLDVGHPKKPLDGKDQLARGVLAPLLEPTPPREQLLPIMMGMPVPPVPLGWKPGDPITLPMDEVVLRKAEEQRELLPVHPVPAGQLKPGEPIQVKHVQLDIAGDSTDDSSSVESSEDDEE